MDTITNDLNTAGDLIKLSASGRYELVKGVLKNLSPSGKTHGFISANICTIISNFVKKHKLGLVTGAETGYKLSSNPDTVRAPDMAFESNDKLAESGFTEGYSTVMPELVVEVNSPNDIYSEVINKVNEWLNAGVDQVWIIEPKNKTVVIHSTKGSTVLTSAEEMDGGDILPGFKCKVAEIFELY